MWSFVHSIPNNEWLALISCSRTRYVGTEREREGEKKWSSSRLEPLKIAVVIYHDAEAYNNFGFCCPKGSNLFFEFLISILHIQSFLTFLFYFLLSLSLSSHFFTVVSSLSLFFTSRHFMPFVVYNWKNRYFVPLIVCRFHLVVEKVFTEWVFHFVVIVVNLLVSFSSILPYFLLMTDR